jgi:glucose/arabinose dehydrogenase
MTLPARARTLALLAAALPGFASIATGCATAQDRSATSQPARGEAVVHDTERGRVSVESFARGLEFPWGLAFMPDGRMLVTERPGRLRIVDAQGNVSAPIDGLPRVLARGQGGLLDVATSPSFARDRTVFLSYAEPTERGGRTAVAALGARRRPDGRRPDDLPPGPRRRGRQPLGRPARLRPRRQPLRDAR